jgi:hypothetical protein
MINLLLLALFNSLFIVGMYRAYSYTDNKIFGKIRFQLEKVLPIFLQKPMFACVWCMASLWSIPVYWFYMLYFTDEFTMPLMIFQYLLYIPVVSTLSGIINDKLIES